ncbi:hypothetical protein LQK80_19015 [Bacillus thuringiensis]|nr:hypothetical protein [Bacillus thuringiensis]
MRKREVIDVLEKYVTINEFMKMAGIGYTQAIFVINSFNIRKIQFIRKRSSHFAIRRILEIFEV